MVPISVKSLVTSLHPNSEKKMGTEDSSKPSTRSLKVDFSNDELPHQLYELRPKTSARLSSSSSPSILHCEVVPRVEEHVAHVGGGVADGDVAVRVALDVVLEVARHGADVAGAELGALRRVDDLVAREEEERVGVVLEGLDDGEGAREVVLVVARPGLERRQGLAGGGASRRRG